MICLLFGSQESTGVKGKIHVSQATADALIKAGKKSWLTEREDKITAKGKGLMTTYFVDVSAGKATSTASGVSQCTDTASADGMSLNESAEEYTKLADC